MDIKDILYKEEQEQNFSQNTSLQEKGMKIKTEDIKSESAAIVKEKKVKKNSDRKELEKTDKVLKYLLALILDFFIFGIMVVIMISLTNIPLIEISSTTGRVLILNRLTIIVICNIFLFMYFYFYAKDHEGSTPMMSFLGIGVVSLKNKVTITSALIYNINFWIFLLIIDLGLVDSLNGVSINVFAMCILLLQVIILILLAGYSFIKVKLVVKEKNEK